MFDHTILRNIRYIQNQCSLLDHTTSSMYRIAGVISHTRIVHWHNTSTKLHSPYLLIQADLQSAIIKTPSIIGPEKSFGRKLYAPNSRRVAESSVRSDILLAQMAYKYGIFQSHRPILRLKPDRRIFIISHSYKNRLELQRVILRPYTQKRYYSYKQQ